MHGVVLDLTYGEDKVQPLIDHEFYLYAVLKPTLARRYEDCPEALALILPQEQDLRWSRLVELGKALNSTLSQEAWVETLATQRPEVVATDDHMVALALGETASRAARYVSETTGKDDSRAGPDAAIAKAGTSVLMRLRDQACGASANVDAPSLALSGGSANGAFIAGVLFELLFAREERYRELTGAKDRRQFLDETRFSAVAGTSVGAMIGQIMDLYAIGNFCGDGANGSSPEKEDVSCPARDAAKKQFLEDIEQLARLKYEQQFRPPTLDKLLAFVDPKPAGDAELARQWALVLLFENFTDIAEPETICVQPGTVSRVVGFGGKAHPGLMRFDPLQRSVLDPFLRIVAGATVANGFPRVAVSVEISQNIAVGLDDAACLGRGERVGDCLAAGTMASTVLPFFAQPVNRVYTGLTDAEDCGIWLDGGLRSGLPIEQALRFTRPSGRSRQPSVDQEPGKGKGSQRLRTLAISTNRALGLPSSKQADRLIDIAGEAIGEMGDQVNTSETQSMFQFAMMQQMRWDHIIQCHDDPQKCGASPGQVAATQSTPIGRSPESGPAADAAPGSATSAADGMKQPVKGGPSSVAGHGGLHVRDAKYLEVIYVPRSAPDYLVASAGYRFDPIVLRGLFVTGQKEALRQTQDGLLGRLGWNGGAGEHAIRLLQLVSDDRIPLEDWLSRVDCSWSRLKDTRRQEGRERFDQRVLSCPEAPTAASAPVLTGDPATTPPPYFGGASDACRCPGREE